MAGEDDGDGDDDHDEDVHSVESDDDPADHLRDSLIDDCAEDAAFYTRRFAHAPRALAACLDAVLATQDVCDACIDAVLSVCPCVALDVAVSAARWRRWHTWTSVVCRRPGVLWARNCSALDALRLADRRDALQAVLAAFPRLRRLWGAPAPPRDEEM